ncbi:hypothetical protein [Nocardioides sp. P5_E3]
MDAGSPLMPLAEVAAADWLAEALPDFRGRVVDLATGLFPSYARIFHRPDQGLPSDDRPATWESIARDMGTVFHPAAQFTDLAREASRPVEERIPGPLIGSLDRSTLPLVRDHLARHTATPATCWFAQWAGFGLTAERWSLDLAFRTLPCSPYWLFGGALSDVVGLSLDFANGGSDDPRHDTFRQLGLVHSPTIWWPQDHAWLVHSSFDYDSTIVGGEPCLIQALVDDPEIEALQVDPDVSLYANGDRINGSYPSGWPQRD